MMTQIDHRDAFEMQVQRLDELATSGYVVKAVFHRGNHAPDPNKTEVLMERRATRI